MNMLTMAQTRSGSAPRQEKVQVILTVEARSLSTRRFRVKYMEQYPLKRIADTTPTVINVLCSMARQFITDASES